MHFVAGSGFAVVVAVVAVVELSCSVTVLADSVVVAVDKSLSKVEVAGIRAGKFRRD